MPTTKIETIYTDDDILVINKPAGLSVTKDRSGAAGLFDVLAEQLGPETAGQLRLVHRLDKYTSGVMILAKNKQTQSWLSSCFEKKLVKKTYLALVTGKPAKPQGTINTPLTHSRKDPRLMSPTRKKGKQAVTQWRLLADFGKVLLLAVNPITGRTHQIRVHLPNIGLPLAIDPLYGSSRPLFLSDFKTDYKLAKDKQEKPLIDRLTLHAYQLELNIPSYCERPVLRSSGSATAEDGSKESHSPDCFIAQLDKKFAACLKMLTKHNPKGLDAFSNSDDFSKIINAQRLS